MKKETVEHIKKTSPVFGTVGAVGGFIADVLQPVAPFSSYLFFASAITSVGILLILVVKVALRTKILPAFFIAISLMVVSGSMYFLQKDETRQSGVLANAIPGIKGLQSAMGIIQKDISEIKETTKRIEESSVRTEELVKKVDESTQTIVGSLQEIQKGFSTLTQSGGVISNPTRPEQFYHNARIQEQGGDYGNARRSYNKYFTFKLDFVDPHLRYQTFLKVQEGRAGAREIYSAMYENDKRPVVEFARVLLFEAPKRIEMLKTFIGKVPKFSPAYYELSREFSEVRMGTQSLTDKKQELESLQKFTKLTNEGKFLKYFVDKELASKWIEDAKERLKALSFISEMKDKSPVSISASKSNSGWGVRIEVSENIREISYRLLDQKEFKTMGFMQFKNPATGLMMPRQEFTLPCSGREGGANCDQVSTEIEVKYIDMTKTERGPYKIVFDGKKQLDIFCKQLQLQIKDQVRRYPGCESFKG